MTIVIAIAALLGVIYALRGQSRMHKRLAAVEAAHDALLAAQPDDVRAQVQRAGGRGDSQ
jgi:hypothetical protein